MKYELAWENRHNCTNRSGHQYFLIRDSKEVAEIRKQHPKLKCALWKCYYCGKIKESM